MKNKFSSVSEILYKTVTEMTGFRDTHIKLTIQETQNYT